MLNSRVDREGKWPTIRTSIATVIFLFYTYIAKVRQPLLDERQGEE